MENAMERDELYRKLEELERQKIEVIKTKKSVAAGYRDTLKEIEDEIRGTLEDLHMLKGDPE